MPIGHAGRPCRAAVALLEAPWGCGKDSAAMNFWRAAWLMHCAIREGRCKHWDPICQPAQHQSQYREGIRHADREQQWVRLLSALTGGSFCTRAGGGAWHWTEDLPRAWPCSRHPASRASRQPATVLRLSAMQPADFPCPAEKWSGLKLSRCSTYTHR